MGFGYIAFGGIDEPIKEQVSARENSFKKFLHNSWLLLQSDKDLQIQLSTFFLDYGYLISLPFIILDAGDKIDIDGIAVGSLITTQMIGAMLSNFLWGRLSGKGHNRLTANISIFAHITAILIAFNASSLYEYMLVFFLVGAAIDGNRIASGNLILSIAPADKRPVYVALHINIVSFGLFFSIIGGIILHFFNYTLLYSITTVILLGAMFFSFKLKD